MIVEQLVQDHARFEIRLEAAAGVLEGVADGLRAEGIALALQGGIADQHADALV